MSEVFLVDGGMRRIASGVGTLTAAVSPGIYKIRTRKGGEQMDRLIEVTGNESMQYERAPSIPLTSAAPIFGSSNSHEFQANPAHQLSLRVHRQYGIGSRLFVYLRDPEVSSNRDWPLIGPSVSIHDLDGNPICDLDAGEISPNSGFGGLNVELNPGTWRLRVETGPLGSYEIFVTTVDGWQTQVFMVMDEFRHAGKTVRRPSLREAVVMMAKLSDGFNPHGDDERLVSLAKSALAYNRPLMAEDTMNRLVYKKFSDPLFGIYALGLLLLEKKSYSYDTTEILRNLERLLGGDHPDLMALKLAFDPEASVVAGPFNRPPLLYQSWQQMLRYSRDNNRAIPGNGLLSQLAEDFVIVRPWLIHRLPRNREDNARSSSATLASAKRTLANLIQNPVEFPIFDSTNMPALSGLEAQILRRIDDQVELNRISGEENSSSSEASQANRIFSRLNAPGYSIANAVERIASRLDVQ